MDDTTTEDAGTPFAAPTPGWSNAAPSNGISSVEGPPTPIVMAPPGWSNNGPAASGATAGAPGSWTPAGSEAPNKFTLISPVVAAPLTAWTTGQYVTLGDGTDAHWSGAAWASGRA